MKIFEKTTSTWDSKVNFVDNNDVYVGYDIEQLCFEDAGWFVADKITPYNRDESSRKEYDVEDYVFDKDFFQTVDSDALDEGCMVAFKLVSKGKPDLFLHLYNCQNGFYGHGFTVKHSGEIVDEGEL